MSRFKERYRIIEEIGRGGMAVVYKGEQIALKRLVAIKHLRKDISFEEEFIKRFEREAKILSNLFHRGITRIYEFVKEEGEYFIIMEYVDGLPLSQLLKTRKALKLEESLVIGSQIARILRFAHSFNVIHRDLKPSNIILTRDGSVKLLDFGVAHLEHSPEALTTPGVALGTPSYMSPEQLRGEQVTVRSDIFSFGIVMYEMISGRKPFESDETSTASEKILKGEFLPLRKVASVPWRMDRLISRCLSFKISHRPKDFNEILKEIYIIIQNNFSYLPEEDVILNCLNTLGEEIYVEPVETDILKKNLRRKVPLPLKLFVSFLILLFMARFHYSSQTVVSVKGKFDRLELNGKVFDFSPDFIVNLEKGEHEFIVEKEGERFSIKCRVGANKVFVDIDRRECLEYK